MTRSRLTHLDARGQARMVPVGGKPITSRRAVAEGFVRCGAELRRLIRTGAAPKGSVLEVARLAGIQAAKQTAALIPLCHSLPLDGVEVRVALDRQGVSIRAEVTATWKTGVEMEALTAVTVAALTVYDMGKAIDKAMTIEGVRLLEKSGGRSGHYRASRARPGRAAR